MKFIGQYIQHFISRFKNDVYVEDLAEQDQEFSVMVDADGKLTKSTHPGERSRLQVRNDEGSTIPAGAPLYSRGEIGGSERIKVGIADANDSAKMPCIGIAEFEMNTSDTKDSFAISQGVYNTNISGFTGLSDGDTLYVDDAGSAPYLTQNKSDIAGSGNAIQNVGIVLKTNGTICQGLLVSAIGRSNDVPNLDNDTIFIGNASNQTTTSALNSINLSSFNNDSGFTTNTGDITGITISDGVTSHTTTSGTHTTQFLTGEGIDVAINALSGTVKQVTYSAEDASTSNKGVASFSSDNFVASAGAISIKSGGVDLTDEVTGNLPLTSGGTGASTVNGAKINLQLDNVPNVDCTNADNITSGTLPLTRGGTGATTAAGARTNLGVDAAGTDNSTNVTLAGQDYLSLSGQEITANDIDLTDDVAGTLPESNGGTGVTDVKTIVTRQVFTANFLDDLETTKHYLPLVDSPNEQTVVYRHEAAVTAPCDGRVASVTIRFENLNTHSGNANVTLGVESRVAGLSYAGTWTVEETETVAIPDTADHDTVHFHFANDKHFDSAELFAVSIQSDTDITGTNERFWVTVVVEWDWSTYLGTKGTSTIYSSTP